MSTNSVNAINALNNFSAESDNGIITALLSIRRIVNERDWRWFQ